MSIARDESGIQAAMSAFVTQVHPVFMLPPLAASLFGMALVVNPSVPVALVHVTALFFAVYTAHVKDGYVDFYLRGEDDDHPMTARGCRCGLFGAAIGFLACLIALFVLAGPSAAAVTLPTWFIGYLHAPQFDTHPVTTTLGYPAGVSLALFGGQYVQSGSISARSLAFAGVFLVVLAGVKVIDDATDYEYDRSIGKRTVAVVLGPKRARRFADRLIAVSLFFVLCFAVEGTFPPSAPVAALAFGIVGAVARRADAKLATMLLVRGAYVFLAILVISVWTHPLAGVAMPSIDMFGSYTYLVTEVAFGIVAIGLLAHANALRSAVRTIAILYPLAYVWDWYTLTVGIFVIRLRTGIDLFAIPIEEHLFIIVVPALVLGIHETIRRSDNHSTPSIPPTDGDL